MRRKLAFFVVALWQVTAALEGKDATFVQIAKTVSYVQTGTSAPVQQIDGFSFVARVDLADPPQISSVSMKWPPPTSATRSLSNLISYWEFSQTYPSSQTLNLAHPNGTYLMVID